LIGKIIAGDLREIASRLYKVAVTRPWTRPCHCREPNHDCHYMYLQTRSITASKCISKLAQSRPRSVSPDSLDSGLQVRTIMASKCISKLARSWPLSASLSSLDLSLQVHLWVHSISVSKSISNTLDQVYLQGATAVVRRCRGNRGRQGDGEYIFGRPQPVQI